MPVPAYRPQDLHKLLEAALNEGDIETFLGLSEESATHAVPPDGRRVHGVGALRAALEPIFARGPRAQMQVVGMLEGDGLALSHGRWELELSEPDGRRVQLSGQGTIVSRRQSDGTWKIVLDDPMARTEPPPQ